MDAGQQHGDLSLHAKWRQVLSLSKSLLGLAERPASEDSPVFDTVNAQCKLIETTATRLLDGQACLWLADVLSGNYQAKKEEDLLPGRPAPTLSPLMRYSLEKGQICCGQTPESSECWHPSDAMEGLSATALASPLFTEKSETWPVSLLGILQIERLNSLPFTSDEIDLFEGLVSQSALALQASLRNARERWRLEQLSLVRQVSSQIADVRDLEELARQVARLTLETFNYYYVAVFTLEPGKEQLRFRASAGPLHSNDDKSTESSYSPALDAYIGEGLVGAVAKTGQEILARDVSQDATYLHVDLLPETRSELVLPLKIEDRILGVFDVQSNQLDDFDETDLLVLRTLAGNIATAVENARLYSALHQRAQQLSTIYEVSQAITSILDQEQLLNDVANLIHERFGYSYVHLFTVHPGRRKVFFETGSGLRSQALHDQEFSYDLDDPLGLIPWVARNAQTALTNDVRKDARYRPAPFSPDDTLSELTVPLIFGSQVLGILDVQSNQLDAFRDEDRFLFEALADHIAIALRNASLYRTESWRRKVADGLREVAGLLSADIDLDQVLQEILLELQRTLPLELAAIWLLDEGSGESDGELAPLHLAAAHGECIADLDLEVGLSPEEILACNPSAVDEIKSGQAAAWLLEAMQSDQPVIRSPQSLFEPLGAILDFPADYSAIAAPLRVGEQPLGVLTLAHRIPGRYGSEAMAMTAAFASYASVAIENARLYEAAHEQAWISTVLLQVAEATQSLDNLNELLTTVIRITPMLVGVRACLLYILDDDGTFVPAAATGLDSLQQAEFERWRFAPGDVPALDQLTEDRAPVMLGDDPDDQRLSGILLTGNGDEISAENGTLVLVPLMAHNEVLGAFLVDYSADLFERNSYKNLQDLFEERLAIIQGIAHQTAVAVENIRLLKSQKEEAYVSVALLQVAQAVVSSNDLDETLGSIVRITPILVGVKRAAIYLWDPALAAFRLSQAYGVPRAAGGSIYALGEFPLLDAVLLEDSLLAQPWWDVDDAAIEIPDAWTRLPAPEMEEVERFLEEEPSLLLAFPLSVKGKVLGVLLAEEPEPAPVEGFSGEGANRRLRGKRLEIITGISQQAALAIQNDLLQCEVRERERLEHEMQLAHDIQRTFLPNQTLDLPGWDLEVYWRPAREVGGDFYDFFELPGNRLGLVIADVADKGMPAALFMTLVRTLVRANVQQASSSAEVLERVNDILVPDAHKGMFVTLAYAVLSLETGEMEYANAGHNPPIVVRIPSCRLEHLERGGMALGVEEGSPIQQKKIRLDPGDYLIMYTDGITEATSLQGDLYEEEQLHQTIRDAATLASNADDPTAFSARDMLEAIDRSVASFIGEALPSDDLTLLVLKRKTT